MPRVLALVAAVVAFVPALTPSAADAAQRTFVATSGVDLAACSLTAPCRSFAAALAQTDAGGEIIVLDSGGYGRVTIDKAVSLIAPPGVYAGISAFATDNEGVRVAAGATDKVVLSGLTINGRGANTGISIVSGGEVNIERCTIANIDFTGVRIGGAPRVYVRGTIIRNNGGYGFWASSGTPEIHVVDSHFLGNGAIGVRVDFGTLDAQRITVAENTTGGILVQAFASAPDVTVTVTDSAISGNGGTGAFVQTNTIGTTVKLGIARSTSARNGGGGLAADSHSVGSILLTFSDSASLNNVGYGLSADGSGMTAIVTGSTLAGNTLADLRQVSSAVLRSSGNNTLTGRGVADRAA